MRFFALCVCTVAYASVASAEIQIPIHYLKQEVEQPPVLSNLDPIPEDNGIAGAMTGLKDNLTTGSFMGHAYTLEVTEVAPGDDWVAAAEAALAESQIIVVDAPAEQLLALADLPSAQSALILNAGSGASSLRNAECRANVLHTKPSTAMRTDALAQFFVKKRWDELAMITGTQPVDVAYADALKNSLTKFGLELEAEKNWVFDADMRRNASQEVPLFTQELGDYDALIVADEIHDFGRYIEYNTWLPRPVTGSEGLSAVTWAAVVEQWGAAQLQSRFVDAHERDMRPLDYAAWAAVRVVGEAVTRINSADPQELRAYMLSDQFELAGFKGRPMTFRTWNGQLRQPIPLVHARALVALAPLEGFLHQRTELDTLGIDEPESACSAFQ